MSDKDRPISGVPLEEVLKRSSQIPKESEWPKGDIRETLQDRSDWGKLLVAVWVKLNKQEYALCGRLARIRKLRGDREYHIRIEGGRIVKCKGSRIKALRAVSDISKDIHSAVEEIELQAKDRQSISPESRDRQRARTQKKRDFYLSWIEDEKLRAYVASQPLDIPEPVGAMRKDPAKNVRAIQEIMIDYLEGRDLIRRKDGVNSAFYEAGQRLGKSDSIMEKLYKQWRKSQE